MTPYELPLPLPLSLAAFFESVFAESPAAAALIGCGGKTSLLWFLAQAFRHKKVLVTVTTKFRRPPPESGLYDFCYPYNAGIPAEKLAAADGAAAQAGITVACTVDEKTGKASALPPAILEGLLPRFDVTVIEADGSRRLPLKGWADYEPVVPAACTHTVGILPVWPLGRPADETIIHRLPLFLEQSGAQPGKPVEAAHIAHLISNPNGLFRAGRGKKILFFNQVESAAGLETAHKITSLLPAGFRRSLTSIIAGSVRLGSIAVITSPLFPRDISFALSM
ncbi:MAG: putative selenium-dependent hydroxylase accessory protein YqeC [Spirochaetaceae bacterium]|jgi:probable selenium-dependent hydroxylase accessory protein YqeC|nr:putative selenium-dependent hydroxylase accessory protein YqeC [Spirochaetaceae bacterium]